MTDKISYKYFKTSPEVIQLAVMYYVRYPLSYRQVEDILSERGIDICHESIRFWVNRFGESFAKKIRNQRVAYHSNWRWHLDEVFVKINGEKFYFGAPLITKVKYWKPLFQRNGANVQH